MDIFRKVVSNLIIDTEIFNNKLTQISNSFFLFSQHSNSTNCESIYLLNTTIGKVNCFYYFNTYHLKSLSKKHKSSRR